ncbi:MAG: lipopolysaccharide heptosyltransferase 1, partial [Phototrophicales bacterium]
EIPSWHFKVDRVIPVAIRRWRSEILKTLFNGEWSDFKKLIGERNYYAVIDAQGLFKSAFLTRYARGPVFGLNQDSVREKLACRYYDHTVNVAKGQHAVERVRQLFAKSLGYDFPGPVGDSGIDTQ